MIVGLDGTCTCHGTRAVRRYVMNLVRCLASEPERHDYRVLRVHPKAVKDVPYPSIRTCDTSIPGRILFPLWRTTGFPPVEFFVGQVDLFHATDLEFPLPAERTPLIWTVHGLPYLARPDLLSPSYVARAIPWLQLALKRASHFIAVSEHTASLLEERFPQVRGRVSAIPLGVGPEFSPDGPQSALVDAPYILYVGALSAIKNIESLIRAYTLLRERRVCSHRLVLAGPIDEVYWRSVSQGAYQDDIVTTGHMDQDTSAIAELYRKADLFVFPSLSEGWTSPPLEAMASGVPVVTSNVSSLPETVGDAALQVPPTDSEALADAMARLLGDAGLRQEMVGRGLQRASLFTWQRTAAATLRVYQEVVAQKVSRTSIVSS
jgi:glycosyltransferase involved in cell wall biosynthesis